MRPLFADTGAMRPDAEPVDSVPDRVPDRSATRRAERYLEWRRNRVVFMRQEADRMWLVPLADLPPQRRGADL